MIEYKLRNYQRDISDLCINNTGKDICVCAPTSAGKTIISYDIAKRSEGRVAILTYANELIRQYRQDFPLPYLIGKAHYPSKKDYEDSFEEATKAKIVLFNPATFLKYQQLDAPKFDTVIWDEADACLGLLQLWDGAAYEFPYKNVTAEAIRGVIKDSGGSDDYASWVFHHLHLHWWEVKEVMKSGKPVRSLHLHPLILSNQIRNTVKAKTNILLSGTLLPSTCQEILGNNSYIYKEIPSVIPVERRKIYSYGDEKFENTLEAQAESLKAILDKFTDRPAVVHTTYSEAKALQVVMNSEEILAYADPTDKFMALEHIESKELALLAGGATTGLNLAYDKCRLNIILRGAFSNLGNDFVRRRKSLPGGQQWYEQCVLRHFVQACGRSTRSPDDFSTIVVSDERLVALAYRNKHLLPEYFKESFFRSFT